MQIDATLTYNSTNPDMQISRTLRSAIGRVSAATFDSDLLPDATNSRNIGTLTGAPKAWKNIFLTGGLIAPKIYPPTDSTTAIQINKADGITNVLNIDTTNGNVGIGTNIPGSALDVKGILRLSGATSGYVGLTPAAVAGSTIYTLPSAIGAAGTFLTDVAGNGTLSWAAAAASGGDNGVFGDGSDGDVIISVNTTLTRDMYYQNLTINAGYTLDPSGFRIFVKDTLTIASTGLIARNGSNGSNGTDASGTSRGIGGAGVAAL